LAQGALGIAGAALTVAMAPAELPLFAAITVVGGVTFGVVDIIAAYNDVEVPGSVTSMLVQSANGTPETDLVANIAVDMALTIDNPFEFAPTLPGDILSAYNIFKTRQPREQCRVPRGKR
jgi:hypothetical protein